MVERLMGFGWWWLAIVAVTLLGVGRLARIITYDSFPPAEWVRQKWADLTKNHEEWGNLFFCPWCMTPWLMAIAIAWFAGGLYVDWLAWSWWIFWGWLGLSYLTSMIVARDEPADS